MYGVWQHKSRRVLSSVNALTDYSSAKPRGSPLFRLVQLGRPGAWLLGCYLCPTFGPDLGTLCHNFWTQRKMSVIAQDQISTWYFVTGFWDRSQARVQSTLVGKSHIPHPKMVLNGGGECPPPSFTSSRVARGSDPNRNLICVDSEIGRE